MTLLVPINLGKLLNKLISVSGVIPRDCGLVKMKSN